MVSLSKWFYDGYMLHGYVSGHERLPDGMLIHTSKVVCFEVTEGCLNAFTHSGTHYYLKPEEIDIVSIKTTEENLKRANVDISFLKKAEVLAKQAEKVKEEEVGKILEENDLYLEFSGIYIRYAYFKKEGIVYKLECCCHIGMYKDSYLIRKPGVVDVRYFDKLFGVDFYHVSDGINNIHVKYVGEVLMNSFTITGLGEPVEINESDTEIKTIKPTNCKEGLFSPDCVNGKSFFKGIEE